MKSTLLRNTASLMMAVKAAVVLLLASGATARQTPLSNHFTYQGILDMNGAPFTGTADFQYTLWDQPTGGSISGTFTAPAVSVSEGGIAIPIDLGSADFNGTTRYLQIAVRTPPGGGAYTTLSPRQKITPTPYALFSLRTRGMWSTADGQNVGIGTPVPSARLEVRDGDFVLGTFNEQWLLHPRSSFGGDFLHITDNDGGVPQFQRGLVIHQNGRVGIGTSAPGEKLTVAGSMEIGTSAGDYQHLRIGGGNSSGFLYGSFPHYADGIHMGYNYYADGAGANQIPAPGGGTSRISMGYGYVALATNVPNFEPVNKLVVDNVVRSLGPLVVTTPNGGNAITATATYGGYPAVYAEQTSGNVAAVYGLSSWTSGNGTGVYGQCNSSNGWDFWAGGAGVNYGAPSSIRWKRNIELINSPLDKVEAMRGVMFDWDAEHGGQHDVGFIGEEVGRVLPEVVAWEDDDCRFVTGMDYSKLTPLLVEAVKALRAEKDAQIDSQQARIAALEQDNQRLQDRLAALEAVTARLADALQKR